MSASRADRFAWSEDDIEIDGQEDVNVKEKKVVKYSEDQARQSNGEFGSGSSEKITNESIGKTIEFGKHGDIKVESLKNDKSPDYVRVTGTRLSDGKRVTIAASRRKEYTHKSERKVAEEEKALAKAKEIPSAEELNKMRTIAGPLGSNGGKWVESDDGRKFLIKELKTDAHAINEVGAGAVYRVAGVAFPETAVRTIDGKQCVVSEKIEGLLPRTASWWNAHPETQAQAAHDFGVDALLSHWDVHGASGDNTLVDGNGKPVRIESGGAMGFRAQGGVKENFRPDGEWMEPSTMRTSEQGRAMYGKMTDAQAADSLERAAKIDTSELQKEWDKLGVPRNVSDVWKETIEARQKQIPAIVEKLRSSSDMVKPLTASDYPSGDLPEYFGIKARNSAVADDPKKARKVKQNISEEMKVRVPAIRMSEGVLSIILHSEDGRVKNQFETGTSGGSLDHEMRRDCEKRAMGVPESTAPAERPVYGYMSKIGQLPGNSGTDEFERNVRHYGQVRVLLKDEVLARSTITHGDSLARYYMADTIAVPALIARDEPSRIPNNALNIQDVRYIELQTSNISINDFKEVQFETEPSESVISALEKNGIKYSIGDKALTKLLQRKDIMKTFKNSQFKLIAEQPTDRYLVHIGGEGSTVARIFDAVDDTLSPEIFIESILARGYWEDITVIPPGIEERVSQLLNKSIAKYDPDQPR